MCVAIHAPAKGKLIPYDEFELMRFSNGDGMGLMWADRGKLRIIRQLRRLGRFWGRYKALHEAGKDVVIHFRLATHGDTTLRNVHPIHVNSRLALVHNGIFSGFSHKDERSDTRQFVDSILKCLPEGWYRDEKIWDTIGAVTAGSKLIFMDSSGFVKIMHESAGWERKGNWFSTLSWDLGSHYAFSYHIQNAFKDGWGEPKCDPGCFQHMGLHTPACKARMDEADRGTARAQFPPQSTYSVGNVAAKAKLHWPSGEIVCDGCRLTILADEPHQNFQPLWDDKEPIVCDTCGECVNQETLEAMWQAEHGVGATVTGG